MTTHTDAKQIVYNRDTRDFSAFFDGELIGCFDTRDAARVALDDHALRLIEDGLVDLPLTLLGAEASHYTCLGCSKPLPAGRGGHCDACVEWAEPSGPPPEIPPGYPPTPGTPPEPGRALAYA